jgi:hypothetical protein
MIIIDYSGLAMGSMLSQDKNAPIDETVTRNLILNTLRGYNVKYKAKYGKMVIACDGGSWRRDIFPEYKANRRKNREEGVATHDWDEIFRIMGVIREEIEEYLPYKVVKIGNVEADDIIAILVETTQEFGNHEDVMIVSADKDFIQLQKYGNVKQYSPMTKKMIEDKNPHKYLFEHILRGDSSDGVPNVLSPDDVFTSGGRQTSLRSTKIDEWYQTPDNLQSVMPAEIYTNYLRNKKMIDLSCIPEDIKESIVTTYNSVPETPNSKVFSYLVKKRCSNMLVSCANEFFS